MVDQNENNKRPEHINAFLKLITLHQPRIYGFIMSLVGNWNDADDIYQETVYVLWSKFEVFTLGTDFLRWALIIARFQILSHIKKKKTQKKYLSQIALENLNETAMSSDKDSGILVDALRKCITNLSQRSRDLLKVRYQDGATLSKIAARFQTNVNTLYKQYQKIHAQLFRCIHSRLERVETE